MELPNDLSYYCFLGTPRILQFRVIGTLFPRLYIKWQDMKIIESLHQCDIPAPLSFKLTLSQASNLRAFSQQADKVEVVLFSFRPGMHSPKPVKWLPYEEPTAPIHENKPEQAVHLYPIV